MEGYVVRPTTQSATTPINLDQTCLLILTQDSCVPMVPGVWVGKGLRVNFTSISDDEVHVVMKKLNNRPRKFLGMKTPYQVFFKDTSSAALKKLNPRRFSSVLPLRKD